MRASAASATRSLVRGVRAAAGGFTVSAYTVSRLVVAGQRPDHPFEHPEAAEAVRRGECLRLAHPAAGPQRGEVALAGARGPDAPPLVDQLVDAVRPQELGLRTVRGRRSHRRQLVDGDVAGDVLPAPRVER